MPTANAFIESFNGSLKDECLNINLFLSLEDAFEKINEWRKNYNSLRPHSSLQGHTWAEIIKMYQKKPDFSVLKVS